MIEKESILFNIWAIKNIFGLALPYNFIDSINLALHLSVKLDFSYTPFSITEMCINNHWLNCELIKTQLVIVTPEDVQISCDNCVKTWTRTWSVNKQQFKFPSKRYTCCVNQFLNLWPFLSLVFLTLKYLINDKNCGNTERQYKWGIIQDWHLR